MDLTHINDQGRAKMVDVSEKNDTQRMAVAYGKICMKQETLEKIKNQDIKKGDANVRPNKLASSVKPLLRSMSRPMLIACLAIETA